MLEIVPHGPAPEYPALVTPIWSTRGFEIHSTNGEHTDWPQVTDHIEVAIFFALVAIIGYLCALVQCERCNLPSLQLYVLREGPRGKVLDPERVCGDCLAAQGIAPRYES